MPLTLLNFQTELPKSLLQKAAKCTVRECDETGKGLFEAYVDENEQSYDVRLRTGRGKEVSEHRCDCGSADAFCRHQAALLLYLAGNTAKKKAAVKGKKVKQSKTDELLQAADVSDLKAWISELLNKNKDLALAFVQHFGEKKTAYTPAEAGDLTAEAVKSVVKNRTRVEQAELKKIVALWSDVHRPIVDAYAGNLTSEAAFAAFHAVLDACHHFAGKLNATGVKISNYVEGLLNPLVEPIAQLFADKAFETATGFYHQHTAQGEHYLRLHYLRHLLKVLLLSTPERLTAGAAKLVQQYENLCTKQNRYNPDYTKALFDFLESNHLLARYLSVFRPLHYDNAFNMRLLEQLVMAGELDQATTYAKAQIKGNYREEYNLPYLELLKKIYRLQNNEEALAGVIADLLPFTFNFDDYLFLYNRMPEGEAKTKWRTKLLNRAKNSADEMNGGLAFYFRLLHYEKNYTKMVGAINAYTPYSIILQYFEPMVQTEPKKLLTVILEKIDNDSWEYEADQHQDEHAVFTALQVAMEKSFGKDALLQAIKQVQKNQFYYRANAFVYFLKKHLA